MTHEHDEHDLTADDGSTSVRVDRHVSEGEARDALNPAVGDDVPRPDDADRLLDADVALGDLDHEGSWRPTRKWLASLAGAVASVVASWITSGEFGDVERGMVATALVALVASYFTRNDSTPGGVPPAR